MWKRKKLKKGRRRHDTMRNSNQALRRRLVALQEKYPAMGLDSLYHLLKPEFGCSRKRVCGWPASPQLGVGPTKLPQIPITAIPLRLTC